MTRSPLRMDLLRSASVPGEEGLGRNSSRRLGFWGASAILLAAAGLSLSAGRVDAQELDESCTVSILNRTVPSQPDGSYIMPNIPTNMGQVRARATCVENGVTRSGQSDFFEFTPTLVPVPVPPIVFGASDPVPESLDISAPSTTLNAVGATLQLAVNAVFSGVPSDVTLANDGTNYTTSNPAVASVSSDGLVTAQASGVVLVTAVNDSDSAFRDSRPH